MGWRKGAGGTDNTHTEVETYILAKRLVVWKPLSGKVGLTTSLAHPWQVWNILFPGRFWGDQNLPFQTVSKPRGGNTSIADIHMDKQSLVFCWMLIFLCELREYYFFFFFSFCRLPVLPSRLSQVCTVQLIPYGRWVLGYSWYMEP